MSSANPIQVKVDQYDHFQGTVVNAQPLPPVISAQGVTAVGHVTNSDSNAVYVHTQPATPINGTVPTNGRQPPRNRWADTICDWPSNLFPSCYCVCCFCCGMYLTAQISQKVGYTSFQNAWFAFCFFCIVGFIFQILFGSIFIVWIPLIFAFIFALGLRLHIARKDDIRDCGGCFGECCTGFWCWYCSVAQMARHVYGYTKVFEGDGDPYRPDHYAPVHPHYQV